MEVLKLALRLALAILRQDTAPRAAAQDARAVVDVALAIAKPAEGNVEAESDAEFCELRAEVRVLDQRYASTPRARWWGPADVHRRADDLLDLAERLQRQGQRFATISEWRAKSVADLRDEWPHAEGNV